MAQNEEEVQDIAQGVLERNQTVDQFGVSQTPYHTHNGADSPQVSYASLTNRVIVFPIVLAGSAPATAANYGTFFAAPFACQFVGANEVHQTAGSDGSAVSLQIEKLAGTTASGSGTVLLLGAFDLKGTANTVQTSMLANVAKKTFALAKGDRLGLKLTGTPTSVATLVVTVRLLF